MASTGGDWLATVTTGPPSPSVGQARWVRVAASLAAVHVAEGGWCQGCAVVWSRWVPFPCPQRRWANAVLCEYGDDDGPDSPALPPMM